VKPRSTEYDKRSTVNVNTSQNRRNVSYVTNIKKTEDGRRWGGTLGKRRSIGVSPYREQDKEERGAYIRMKEKRAKQRSLTMVG
jgi:hypothetical protein